MHAYVGVTDIDWYLQLRSQSLPGGEVNFWFPSSKPGFDALTPGDVFIFKTHVDRARPSASNRIVGAAIYSGYARLRVSEAWHWFDLANGVESREALRQRIEHYRSVSFDRFEDPEIGCVMLRDAVFCTPDDAMPAPTDFSLNIVRGKRYDLSALPDSHEVQRAVSRYLEIELPALEVGEALLLSDRTHGDPITVIPRVGQRAFKGVVAEAYHHHCAVTGDKVRPVLQAAHILPIGKGGQHRVDNGLLLRSDVHILFDDGYLGLDSRFRLKVSPAIRERYGNGDWFYARHGQEIDVPDKTSSQPNAEFLDWHMENVYLR
jgi:putative restriction endonuclease